MIVVKTDASVHEDGCIGIGWQIELMGNSESYLQSGKITGHDYFLGKHTSTQAEIVALCRGFKEALRFGERDSIILLTDCRPLISKIENHAPVVDGSYVETIHFLSEYLNYWDVKWVSRDDNMAADSEASLGVRKLRRTETPSLSD